LCGDSLVTENRKIEHLKICLERDVSARQISTGFGNIHLIHDSISNIDLNEISTSIKFLGHELSMPLLISPMTGGTPEAKKFNGILSKVAEEMRVAIGVGSVRAALQNPDLRDTYRVVRENAPDVPVISNIGLPQVAKNPDMAFEAVSLLDADAIFIHLNKLQEVVMREGEPTTTGGLQAIEYLIDNLEVPIILKETGACISREAGETMDMIEVKYVDIGGAGGTSFAAVEYYRARNAGDEEKAYLGLSLWDWGIPTVASLIEVSLSTRLEIICSGGVRTGIDAAKAMSLGAKLVGVALPLLRAASDGVKGVKEWMQRFHLLLRSTMFLVGATDISQLRRKPLVVTGFIREWMASRGLDPEVYGRRQ